MLPRHGRPPGIGTSRAQLLGLGVDHPLRPGAVRGSRRRAPERPVELGAPARHRSDSLSAAVNNLSAKREFHARYRHLLDHYGLAGERINVRAAHENGDNESARGHFKTAADQALLMHGTRDFVSRAEYLEFLQGLGRRAQRRARGSVRRGAGGAAPAARVPDRQQPAGPVPGLFGEPDPPQRVLDPPPADRPGGRGPPVRRPGRGVVRGPARGHAPAAGRPGPARGAVPARHRLPGEQAGRVRARYRYREDLFPTTRFRTAFDWLVEEHGERVGTKQYLRLLHHAARESEASVDDALRVLLAGDGAVSSDAVPALARRAGAARTHGRDRGAAGPGGVRFPADPHGGGG